MTIIQRLRNPPLGTETSERNLMAQAAAEIERLKKGWSECDGKLGKRPCQTGRCMEYLELQSALRRCLELMHNGGTWDIGEQHRMATLAGKEVSNE